MDNEEWKLQISDAEINAVLYYLEKKITFNINNATDYDYGFRMAMNWMLKRKRNESEKEYHEA